MDELVVELQEKISEHFVDFNDVQTDASTSNANTSSGSSSANFGTNNLNLEKPLVVKQTVCYIVCAVVIEDGKVLMMREAKKSCRGLWYLPAGRVEKNETLVQAAKREVLEETGLAFEPSNLVSIEGPSLDWIRFTFTGKITGGRLKTIKDQDKESLEAGWHSIDHVRSGLPLRAPDILPLIKFTIGWNQTKKSDPIFSILPQNIPHSRNRIQLVLIQSHDQNGMEVLTDRKNGMRFLEITPTFSHISIRETAVGLAKRALMSDHLNIIGVIRVEHSGGPCGTADGTSLTLLAEVKTKLLTPKSRYMWCGINDENIEAKLLNLSEKGCVELK